MKDFSTLLKTISVLLILLTFTAFAETKYAILLAGDYTATNVPSDQLWNGGQGNYSEFWNDLFLQWETLYNSGYDKENIIVLFANGQDMWKEDGFEYIDTRYRAEWVTRDPYETITRLPATRNGLNTAVSALKEIITPDDFLYVWVMSHGGTASQSSIGLIGSGGTYDEMIADEFAQLFENVPANKKLFRFSLNYADGFIEQLKSDNTTVIINAKE